MPIYEFRCRKCGKRSSVFTRSVIAEVKAACEHCRSRRLERLMSRVAVHRSGDDDFYDAALGGVDENDPKAMARWVRQMSEREGEPIDAETESALERMEAGDLLDDGDDGDGFDDDFSM